MVLQMIQDPEEQNDIKCPNALRRQVRNVDIHNLHRGRRQVFAYQLDAAAIANPALPDKMVGRHHARSTTAHRLQALGPIPAADIQHCFVVGRTIEDKIGNTTEFGDLDGARTADAVAEINFVKPLERVHLFA